jgi:hypothetical protein
MHPILQLSLKYVLANLYLQPSLPHSSPSSTVPATFHITCTPLTESPPCSTVPVPYVISTTLSPPKLRPTLKLCLQPTELFEPASSLFSALPPPNFPVLSFLFYGPAFTYNSVLSSPPPYNTFQPCLYTTLQACRPPTLQPFLCLTLRPCLYATIQNCLHPIPN